MRFARHKCVNQRLCLTFDFECCRCWATSTTLKLATWNWENEQKFVYKQSRNQGGFWGSSQSTPQTHTHHSAFSVRIATCWPLVCSWCFEKMSWWCPSLVRPIFQLENDFSPLAECCPRIFLAHLCAIRHILPVYMFYCLCVALLWRPVTLK